MNFINWKIHSEDCRMSRSWPDRESATFQVESEPVHISLWIWNIMSQGDHVVGNPWGLCLQDLYLASCLYFKGILKLLKDFNWRVTGSDGLLTLP